MAKDMETPELSQGKPRITYGPTTKHGPHKI